MTAVVYIRHCTLRSGCIQVACVILFHCPVATRRIMSSIKQCPRGRKFLLKVLLLLATGAAILWVAYHYEEQKKESSLSSKPREEAGDRDGDIAIDVVKRMAPLFGDNIFNRRRDPKYKNPCVHIRGRRFMCIPYVYIAGLDPVGDGLLYRAVLKHEDVVNSYPSFDYFAQFQSMDDFEVYTYVQHYNTDATFIKQAGNGDDLILIEKGQHLARFYSDPSTSDTSLERIMDMYEQTKIIFVVRNPTERVYAEWCAEGNDPKDFSAKVPSAIDKYQDCLENRQPKECIQDASIYDETGLNLARGLYCNIWDELIAKVARNQIKWVHWEKLTNPKLINLIMKEVFIFLELNEFSDFNFAGLLSNDAVCDGVPMDKTVKESLDVFYKACNALVYSRLTDSDFIP